MLDRISVDGELLLVAAARAGWDTPVPGLAWDVRTVVTHTGAVHRWAADIVRRALPTNETGGSSAFWPTNEADSDLRYWDRQGLDELISELHAVGDDLECFTFIKGVPAREFWVRRQAHETAIHRVDVELAAGGPVTPVDAEFAQDGIAELVDGFATQSRFASTRRGTLLFAASDGPSWLVTFGGYRNQVASDVPGDSPADAVVSGTGDALYRWAWNRAAPEAKEAGSVEILASWREVRIS